MARVSTGKNSNQVQYNPPDLIRAVDKYWPLGWDLASKDKSALYWVNNCFGSLFCGPGSIYKVDSFKAYWNDLLGWLWLNPPYNNIGPWFRKCKEESILGARIVSLVNFDTADWFCSHVPGYADIVALKGRLVFCDIDGKPIVRVSEKTKEEYTASNPKSSCLVIWRGPEYGRTRFSIWDYKKDKWLTGHPWATPKDPRYIDVQIRRFGKSKKEVLETTTYKSRCE